MATHTEEHIDHAHDQAQRTSNNLFQIAWQRKSLVMLGLVIGIIAGTLFYFSRKPVYQSNAQVLVVKKNPDNIVPTTGTDSRAAYMEDYLATHAILLRSPKIVGRAVQSKELTGLQSFSDVADPTYYIIAGLQVQREMRDATGGYNNILNLRFQGPVPAECKKILEAIINQYQLYLNEMYKSAGEQALDLIQQAKVKLNDDVNKKVKEYEEFRQSSPLPAGGGAMAMYRERMNKYDQIIADKKLILEDKRQQLRTLEKVYAEQGPQQAILYIQAIGIVVTLTGDTDIDRELIRLSTERTQLELKGIGEKHPQMQAVIAQEKELRKHWEDRTGTKVKNDNINSVEAEGKLRQDFAKQTIEKMKMEVQNYENTVTTVESFNNKIAAEARQMTNFDLVDERMKGEIASSKKLFDTIANKLSEINLVKDQGGFTANLIAEPRHGVQVQPNAFSIFPAATVIGLMLGMGLAYLAELSDKSFRNPAEIQKRLGMKVIGHVPFLEADTKATQQVAAGISVLDPMLVTHYHSTSIGAEAYRGVRTSLYFSTQGIGHQVIQVTSPNVSDGKSTLAANLAVSIAQSGKRTVILDADFRKPRVHKIFNVPATVGLASVVAGQATLADAIQASAIPNLFILPCGPRPANPAELLTTPQFKHVLEEIRTQFDFVIVDTPPLLVVTDPSVVAPRVDGVVLCIRVTKNGRPYAKRAREVLNAMSANVLGVVVNGFGGNAGGRYGYEHYQYGYGDYGQGYQYGYTYSDPEAASYYADADGVVPGAKKKK